MTDEQDYDFTHYMLCYKAEQAKSLIPLGGACSLFPIVVFWTDSSTGTLGTIERKSLLDTRLR